ETLSYTCDECDGSAYSKKGEGRYPKWLEKIERAPGVPAPGPKPAPAPATTQPDPAKGWAQIPQIFGGILSRWFPELGPVYTEQQCLAWGTAMVPLAEKYGWNISAIFEWLGPWFGLALATEPLAVPTVLAIRARIAAARAAQEAEQA